MTTINRMLGPVYRTRHTLTVAQRAGVFAVFAFLKHSQRLEQIDVLRQRRRCGGHLHVGGSFSHALRVPPVARLALYRQKQKNGQPKVVSGRSPRSRRARARPALRLRVRLVRPTESDYERGSRVRVHARGRVEKRHESDPKLRFCRKVRARRTRYKRAT